MSKQHRIVAINDLKHIKYRLTAPIFVALEFESDKVIASFDDIEAFAYADTEYEALAQLCEEIVQIYEDLREDRDNLGAMPSKWLSYLEEIIECR
jgi:hypothetical protein